MKRDSKTPGKPPHHGIFLIILSCTILSILSIHTVQGSRSKAAAMILDVKGHAFQILPDKTKKPISPMDTIKNGTLIRTGKGGKVTLVLLANNREFSLEKNSEAKILTDKITGIKGKITPIAAQVALDLPTNSVVHSRRILGHALTGDQVAGRYEQKDPINKNEGTPGGENTTTLAIPAVPVPPLPPVTTPTQLISFTNPVHESTIPDTRVTFTWTVPKADRVTLSLFEIPEDKSLQESQLAEIQVTKTDSFTCPSNGYPPLKPGTHYRAVLSAYQSNPDTKKEFLYDKTETLFKIASKEQNDKVNKYLADISESRKTDPDSVSSRVKLMIFYYDNGMYRESLALANELEKIMPHNDNLKFYLLLLHTRLKNYDLIDRYKSELDRIKQ